MAGTFLCCDFAACSGIGSDTSSGPRRGFRRNGDLVGTVAALFDSGDVFCGRLPRGGKVRTGKEKAPAGISGCRDFFGGFARALVCLAGRLCVMQPAGGGVRSRNRPLAAEANDCLRLRIYLAGKYGYVPLCGAAVASFYGKGALLDVLSVGEPEGSFPQKVKIERAQRMRMDRCSY